MKRDCGELLLVLEAALRGIVRGPVAPHREQDARQLACQRDCRYELSSTLFGSKYRVGAAAAEPMQPGPVLGAPEATRLW